MSHTISRDSTCPRSSEPEPLARRRSETVRDDRVNAWARGIAPLARATAGLVLLVGVLVACGDRRIVFCDAGYDPATEQCRVVAPGGAGGGGAGGSAGGTAGSGGAGGTAGSSGTGGGGAGGVGGSPADLDASVPLDAGDASDTSDAAAVP